MTIYSASPVVSTTSLFIQYILQQSHKLILTLLSLCCHQTVCIPCKSGRKVTISLLIRHSHLDIINKKTTLCDLQYTKEQRTYSNNVYSVCYKYGNSLMRKCIPSNLLKYILFVDITNMFTAGIYLNIVYNVCIHCNFNRITF